MREIRWSLHSSTDKLPFVKLIEVENLKKDYLGDSIATPALQGVSFAITKGEFVAIMGPSGCGKSTLLHILGFLDQPSAGSYYFNRRSYLDYSDEELAELRNKQVGFIFQAFNLLPRTSVLENVKLPLIYSKVNEEQWDKLALRVIDQVKLTHRLRNQPSELSGGEQQRVAIARALINKPQIILADEPTGNLDSRSGKMVMEVISGFSTQGHTVILITHDPNIAQYAKRIINLKDGQIERDYEI